MPPEFVFDVVEGGLAVAADADVGEDFRQSLRRRGGALGVRSRDHQRALASEAVGDRLDQAVAGAEVVDRDGAGVDQFGDVGIVAADEHGGGLAGGGLDLVQAADDRHGEPGGLEGHAGGQVRDALSAASRNHDHVDIARDLPAAQESTGRVKVGEIEAALGAPARPGPGARGRRCHQSGEDDLPAGGLEGERSEVPETQVVGTGAVRVVADPLPREDLQAVEGIAGLGRAGVVVVCESGGEVDVVGAVGGGWPGGR